MFPLYLPTGRQVRLSRICICNSKYALVLSGKNVSSPSSWLWCDLRVLIFSTKCHWTIQPHSGRVQRTLTRADLIENQMRGLNPGPPTLFSPLAFILSEIIIKKYPKKHHCFSFLGFELLFWLRGSTRASFRRPRCLHFLTQKHQVFFLSPSNPVPTMHPLPSSNRKEI